MRFPANTPRLLHLTIMGLLLFSVVQVGWWFYDIRENAQVNATAMKMVYGYDMLAAQKLVDQGMGADQIAAVFPYARIENGKVSLAVEALDDLNQATRARMTQYAWEGGFFLLVQACAIAVLWGGLTSETAIRRKQDSFLAMVSHQFKTPIASLQLSLETMMLRELSPERFQQLSRRMLDDLHRMENMVSKILDSARLDRGRVQLNRERLFLLEHGPNVVARLDAAELAGCLRGRLLGRRRRLQLLGGAVLRSRLGGRVGVHDCRSLWQAGRRRSDRGSRRFRLLCDGPFGSTQFGRPGTSSGKGYRSFMDLAPISGS